MVNSTGACRLAATVCPASTLRRITVPSTGARMMVRSRSTWACLSSESRCFTAARALATCASLTLICACTAFSCSRVVSSTTCALSSSAGGDEFLVDQHLLACEVALGVGERDLHAAELGLLGGEPGARHRHRAFGGVEVGARLVDAQLEGRRVDARDDLALLHGRVEVRVDVLDLARDLRAHLDRGDRVQRAARHDHGGQGPALDLREPVPDLAVAVARLVPVPAAGGERATAAKPRLIFSADFIRLPIFLLDRKSSKGSPLYPPPAAQPSDFVTLCSARGAPEYPGFATVFLVQAQVGKRHAAVDGLHHVVDREQPHGPR